MRLFWPVVQMATWATEGHSRGPPIWVILLRAACGEPVSSRAGEGGAWQRGTSHRLQGTLFDILAKMPVRCDETII
jgi:hypothetical protein